MYDGDEITTFGAKRFIHFSVSSGSPAPTGSARPPACSTTRWAIADPIQRPWANGKAIKTMSRPGYRNRRATAAKLARARISR